MNSPNGLSKPVVFTKLDIAKLLQPVTLVLSLTLWIPGVLAIVYGENVSRGLSNIGVGFMARVMGAVMVAGTLLVAYSIFRNNSILSESIGLVLIAFGLIIYGIGVMFGLGMNGAFAGPVALSLALALVYRAKLLPDITATEIRRRES